MGVKLAATQNGTKSVATDPAIGCQETLSATLTTPEVPSASASVAGKVNDKQQSIRRKGMEKSVLDDIMGDPDDFRDLADSDAESEGGRWEDTVRESSLDEAGILEGELQIANMGSQQRLDATSKVLESSAKKEDLQLGSISSDKMVLGSVILQEPETSGHKSSEGWHQVDAKEKNKYVSNDGTANGSSGLSKVHQTRYFVIKSLNRHNISKSIEKGIWATQAMNEPILNEAFETSERVLLIFSVNMSGHFQGYAQMVSPIGRRRATVWNESNSGSNPWGGSFSVEWLRLYDLPFQKTVHLKNPLNSFKPVKISRDCQELTEEIGEALCALIDEGAEKEGKLKRKAGLTDAALSKRPRGEVSVLSLATYGPQVLPVPVKGPVAPSVFCSGQLSPVLSHEPYNPHTPLVRPSGGLPSTSSVYFEQAQSSKSRSPRRSSTEKNLDWDKDREKGCHEGKGRVSGREREPSRVSGSKRSADLPPEEDLLNMTYEEYLQRHGNSSELNGYHQAASSFSSYQSTPFYGANWMGSQQMGYSDDQYSNYLAKWYSSQQGSVVSGDCYFTTGAVTNPFSGMHPP